MVVGEEGVGEDAVPECLVLGKQHLGCLVVDLGERIGEVVHRVLQLLRLYIGEDGDGNGGKTRQSGDSCSFLIAISNTNPK